MLGAIGCVFSFISFLVPCFVPCLRGLSEATPNVTSSLGPRSKLQSISCRDASFFQLLAFPAAVSACASESHSSFCCFCPRWRRAPFSGTAALQLPGVLHPRPAVLQPRPVVSHPRPASSSAPLSLPKVTLLVLRSHLSRCRRLAAFLGSTALQHPAAPHPSSHVSAHVGGDTWFSASKEVSRMCAY